MSPFSGGLIWALALQLAAASQPATGIIAGIVEDSLGGAVANATVTATCGSVQRRTTSNADGGFDLRDVPAQPCEVSAERALFAPASVEVDLSNRRSAFVRLVLPVAGIRAEVTVTPGLGEQDRAFQVPESIAVTTREELESRPHHILPQVLGEEAGVLVQQTTTAQGSAFIRGFSAQRIVYLLDGVRLNTSTFRSGATQYLGWVHSSLAQRIELVRGPASVQYGSDAIAGAVNVIGARPGLSPSGTRVRGTVEGLFGSADLSGGAEAQLTVEGPSFALRAAGGARNVEEVRAGRARDSHSALSRFLGLPSTVRYSKLPDTDFSQAGAHVAATVKAGDDSTLNLLFAHEQQFGVNRYDRVLGGDGLHRSEFEPQRFDFGYVRYQRGSTAFLDDLTVGFSVNRQRDDRLEQARPLSRIEREQGLVTAFGYHGQGTWLVTSRHGLTIGGEAYDEYIATTRTFEDPGTGFQQSVRPRIPDGTRYTSSGVFAQSVSQLVPGRLSVRGGLRLAHFRFQTRPDPRFSVADERVSTTAATFHAGGVVGLSDAINATFTVSRGFRAPNAFDLGAIGLSGGGFEIAPGRAQALGTAIGTTDGVDAVTTGRLVERLSAESAYAFEAGLKFRTGRLLAAITAFDLELVDIIQRRTAIFPDPVVGRVIAGVEIVRQDGAGRAFVEGDPRPIVTRANIDRARVVGFEAEAQMWLTPEWLTAGHFSMANGHELGAGTFLRRMPPAHGGGRLKWEPSTRGLWLEGVASFALEHTRLSPGDLSDARIGALRSREAIAAFFDGTAADLGLVRDGVLVATGETLTQVQARVLGEANAAALFTRTPGFFVLGARGGFRFGPAIELTVIADNLADRNYRWHGSGVDAPGFNLQVKTRYSF